ncbi:MAG: DNA polymerase IV [Dehalococcoidia bacterium]|nr:DNA polymerase IV [Dehalococcoidia bacterium]
MLETQRTTMNSTRYIIHADMDAFFAAVEQKDNPALLSKPVLVGGKPESRGVVASCSYEARYYGIHSAMPMATAVRKCPDAIIMPPRFDRYSAISKDIMQILESFTPWIQPIALDEAFLDITETVSKTNTPLNIAKKIKESITQKTGLNISIGIGTTKSIAKIASGLGKPDGLVLVQEGQEAEFLKPLSVRYLPGIGPKTSLKLNSLGIETLGQLADKSIEWGTQVFGKKGPDFILMSRGIDGNEVVINEATKSISIERTFPQNVSDPNELFIQLSDICINLGMKLDQQGLKGRTVSLKLRLENFKTFTRSKTHSTVIWEPTNIYSIAITLLHKELKPGRLFRLIGVTISNFELNRQSTLFN